MSNGATLGELVASHPAGKPGRQTLDGRYVKLVPVDVSQAPALFQRFSGPSGTSVFTYLPGGPYDTLEAFTQHLASISSSQDPHFFAVIPKEPLPGVPADTAVGYVSFLNIELTNRSVEIGHVTFSPSLQRTTAATEVFYLLLRYAFVDLGYRRLEWKCDSLNAKSKRAAERLGFSYEGLFRKHRIVRGRNRDTCWYSITDDEWPSLDEAFKQWLSQENFDNGRQIKSLEFIRKRLGSSVKP